MNPRTTPAPVTGLSAGRRGGPRAWATPRRLALGLLVALLVIWPTAAVGHADQLTSTPTDGQVLEEPPTALTVTFTEPVSLARGGNQLLGPQGQSIDVDVTVQDAVLTVRPTETLGTGTHVLAWRVVSADSHPIAGGVTFAVGTATPAPASPTTADDRRELDIARSSTEALRYAGLLGVVGLAALVLLIAPTTARDRVARTPGLRRSLVVAGSVGVASVLLVPLTAIDESGEGLIGLVRLASWTDGARSPAGAAAALATAGVLALAIGLRRRVDLLAIAGAALAVTSVLPVGHTRSYGPGWLVLLADLAHVLAGAIWWGGLIGLALVLRRGSGVDPRVRAAVLARFSAVAGALVAVVLVAGVVLYWRIGHSVSGLWSTGYGRAVLLKSALVVPVLVAAAWNARRLVPRLADRDAREVTRVLTRTVSFEAGLIAAVLVVTSVLVTRTPPPREPTVVATETRVLLEVSLTETHRARIVVTPVRRGANSFQVTVTDEDGDPFDPVETPRLTGAQEAAGVGPFPYELTRTDVGRWEGVADLPLPGTWTLSLAVRLTEFEAPVIGGTMEVP